MSIQTCGNKTCINIERQREINSIMDGLSEDDSQYDKLMAELRELNIWHGDTVPDHIYYATIFQDKIVPAQIAHIDERIAADPSVTSIQLTPELADIARTIFKSEDKLEYPDFE